MTGKLKLLAVTLPLAGLFMAIAAVFVNDEMKQVQVQMEKETNLTSYSQEMKKPVMPNPSQKSSTPPTSTPSSEGVSEPSSSQPQPQAQPQAQAQPQPPVSSPSSTSTEEETNESIAASLAESFSKQGDEVHVIGGAN